MANIPVMSIVVVLIPMLIGMLPGNLVPEMREILTKGGPLLLSFFAFVLGASVDLAMLLKGGLAGIMPGVITPFVGGFFSIKIDRLLG